MIKINRAAEKLNLKEGWLCLDFANTANWHASDRPVEELNSYAELVLWAQEVGVLTAEQGQQLLHEAANRPAEARAALAGAIELREAIYRIFSAVAAGRPVAEADLATLNEALSRALSRLQITRTAAGFGWRWLGEPDSLSPMLWPVAQSAAELLTAPEVDRVKECADDRGCGYLFLDMSRNRSRRWCDMKSCGNRAKVRRYRRHLPADP